MMRWSKKWNVASIYYLLYFIIVVRVITTVPPCTIFVPSSDIFLLFAMMIIIYPTEWTLLPSLYFFLHSISCQETLRTRDCGNQWINCGCSYYLLSNQCAFRWRTHYFSLVLEGELLILCVFVVEERRKHCALRPERGNSAWHLLRLKRSFTACILA